MQMLSSRQFAVIATVIEYLYEHLDQQPSLDDVCESYEFKPKLYSTPVSGMGRD